MPATSAFKRPVRKAVIDGEEWYSLSDVCTRLKADRSYWQAVLGEHARQTAVAGHSHEQTPWFVDGEGLFRIAFAARAIAEASEFRDRCVERLAKSEAVKLDAARMVMALDGRRRKSDKAVTADEVRQWQRMRDEEGLALNQIQKRTGRSRSLVRTYLNPETAPAWAKREIYGMAD